MAILVQDLVFCSAALAIQAASFALNLGIIWFERQLPESR